jgi:hypothetical protein
VKYKEINESIADYIAWNWYAVEKRGLYYREGGHGYTNQIHEAGKYTKEDANNELCAGEPMSVVRIPVPDFVNDLNAMHEAEKYLISGTPGLWECYENRLKAWHGGNAIHATASERAETFLRTIGKWKEAKP